MVLSQLCILLVDYSYSCTDVFKAKVFKCFGEFIHECALRAFAFCTQRWMEAGPDGQHGRFVEVIVLIQEYVPAENPLKVMVVVLVTGKMSS